jgi:hypothetical protein
VEVPTAVLRRSIAGEVATVSEGAVPVNQTSKPIVTLRLERHDPHAGPTHVATVRLQGGDALGFARVGDWVEATGRNRSAHLVASHCVNHSTGAVYRAGFAARFGVTLLTFTAVVVAGIVFLLIFMVFVVGADKAADTQRQQFMEECIKSGVPRSVCEVQR